jgi:mannose-6-phosphate isomerase-like protein (cupin superfamily)
MHVEIDGEVTTLGAGDLVLFPSGRPHRNWNEGGEPTVHLAISAPAPDPDVPFARPVG